MSVAAHQERLMTVIRGPHISEKSHRVAEMNQVVLKVRTDATKKERFARLSSCCSKLRSITSRSST